MVLSPNSAPFYLLKPRPRDAVQSKPQVLFWPGNRTFVTAQRGKHIRGHRKLYPTPPSVIAPPWVPEIRLGRHPKPTLATN